MDRTEATLRKLFAALPAPGYDLGILSEQGMYRLEAVAPARIVRMLSYLKYRNATGAHIYMRPTGESSYVLLDDLTTINLNRLIAEGYGPAAVVETSPGSLQAWLKHSQPLSKVLGTLAAKILAEQFGADRSAADWRRFGRAPGFTNRKPQYRNAEGLYPFAQLRSYGGQVMPADDFWYARLLALQRKTAKNRIDARRKFESYSISGFASLSRFRALSQYVGRPAAADMAFSIAACAEGWSTSDIAIALRQNYLSRDPNEARKAAYIRRTILKALSWAA